MAVMGGGLGQLVNENYSFRKYRLYYGDEVEILLILPLN